MGFFTSSLTLQTGVLLSTKFSNNPGSEQLSSAGLSGSDCGDSAAVWRATPVKTNQFGKKLRFTPSCLLLEIFYSDQQPQGEVEKK